MGDLIDRLNKIDPYPHAPGEPIRSLGDQVAGAFHLASERVNDVIAAAREPGMLLDQLSRWTRQAPLPALAFLVGVIATRRR
jgi:hypothetical protein